MKRTVHVDHPVDDLDVVLSGHHPKIGGIGLERKRVEHTDVGRYDDRMRENSESRSCMLGGSAEEVGQPILARRDAQRMGAIWATVWAVVWLARITCWSESGHRDQTMEASFDSGESVQPANRFSGASTPSGMGLTINLNQAMPQELALLPGVGRQLAHRITANRRRSGPFTSIDDLTRVPGIGPKTVTNISPFAFAGPP